MKALLEVRDLAVRFPRYGGLLRRRIGTVSAVDGVSFELAEGEVLGLVGESGSGKTSVARAVVNLHRAMTPDVSLAGRVLLRTERGQVDLNGLGRRAMRPYRAQVQMIFQDPDSSLNPRSSVQALVERPLELHARATRRERRARALALLERVGLDASTAGRYPHELSGGQRQRVGIACALATRPRLLVADEPVSALDVSVRAQVLELMRELAAELRLTTLFVAHDLSIVRHVADRIAVMYLGRIVEIGGAEELWTTPRHPYTRALLSAVPVPDPRADRSGRIRLVGDVPSPLERPSGCGFRTRCPIAQPACATDDPALLPGPPGSAVACPFADRYVEMTGLK